MNGRLLVAADFVYRFYSNATFFDAIFRDQFSVQLGAQYDTGRFKLRAGYVWAASPIKSDVGETIGGIPLPGEENAVQYVQAQFAAIAKNRISVGIGIPDIFPNMDLDLFAGGMFKNSQELGESFASIESYWLGGGFTWHFGCLCDREYSADECCQTCDATGS